MWWAAYSGPARLTLKLLSKPDTHCSRPEKGYSGIKEGIMLKTSSWSFAYIFYSPAQRFQAFLYNVTVTVFLSVASPDPRWICACAAVTIPGG